MSALLRWGFDRKAGAKKRPVPLVRAYTGPFPDRSSRTMAEVMRDEALALRQAQGERVEKKTKPPAILVGEPEPVKPVQDKAKPRIKSGATVAESKQAAVMPVQPASVPVAVEGRDPPPAPSPSARAHDHDGRAVMVRKAPAPVDWGRVANAARMREVSPPKPKPAPTVVALSREACVRCGVPGWRGCDHQLPYEEAK
ncbi:MAG: hypothetical protein B7Y36_08325 [Novosphingobium sp. 28-62-57]|uniref:hypothetical protein n=1 Tax=unclassified Novosphingobium TaxID=2644732 RepID=UPI000BD2D79D|nr:MULTISPECIES: hypothetical protein [unclassified Novosphingobium]OYW47929.1 MAG: hypothetical protein B7Z36_01415 [Novosphingobium sp. 12-63-9]OYZ10822.1 MAG: hypothetical protein B7Y36_08325 [Novosphingobium sp. 28-62-57]HQS70012.1 hypothetical protein [Novosphingobium sp.]